MNDIKKTECIDHTLIAAIDAMKVAVSEQLDWLQVDPNNSEEHFDHLVEMLFGHDDLALCLVENVFGANGPDMFKATREAWELPIPE